MTCRNDPDLQPCRPGILRTLVQQTKMGIGSYGTDHCLNSGCKYDGLTTP